MGARNPPAGGRAGRGRARCCRAAPQGPGHRRISFMTSCPPLTHVYNGAQTQGCSESPSPGQRVADGGQGRARGSGAWPLSVSAHSSWLKRTKPQSKVAALQARHILPLAPPSIGQNVQRALFKPPTALKALQHPSTRLEYKPHCSSSSQFQPPWPLCSCCSPNTRLLRAFADVPRFLTSRGLCSNVGMSVMLAVI